MPGLLTDERLAPLWRAVHARLETNSGQVSGATAHIRRLTEDQRAAVDRLLGVRSRGTDVHVSLDRLDDLLRERLGYSLVEVVSALTGPVHDRAGERTALATAEATMWDRVLAHPVLDRNQPLREWLSQLRTSGVWRRLDDPQQRLVDALNVFDHLPQAVPCGRSRFATRILGRAHDLSDDAPTGRLVTAGLAHLAGLGSSLRAADRRKLWADQGVISDETSSTVLTLGLRPLGVGPLTEAAARWADGSAPLPIPLAAVQMEHWEVVAGTPIWVCENPSILAAAAGTKATVISLEGWPSRAAVLLLRSLSESGAQLAYHGDFGHGGIAIANQVISELGASPWRFGVDDHRWALRQASEAGTNLQPLRGSVPDASWDPDLAPSIRSSGVEVEEELVIDLLLEDLRRGRHPSTPSNPSPPSDLPPADHLRPWPS